MDRNKGLSSYTKPSEAEIIFSERKRISNASIEPMCARMLLGE